MTIAVHLGTDHRASEDWRECYWLDVVTNRDEKPQFQVPIKDPARMAWHHPVKAQHYWLEVDAISEPMRVAQEQAAYHGDGT